MSIALHSLIFTIGAWLAVSPFLIPLIYTRVSDLFAIKNILSLDTFFPVHDLALGLFLFAMILFLAIFEQGRTTTPAMHYFHIPQGFSALALAILPFMLSLSTSLMLISHLALGGFIAVLALLQLKFESID